MKTEINGAQYARSLIDACLDPIVTISVEGKIADSNKAYSNISGHTKESLKGTTFQNYFTKPQKTLGIFQMICAEEPVVNVPLKLRHQSKKLIDVIVNGSVVKDDHQNILGLIIVSRDVTGQGSISKELSDAILTAEMATAMAEEATKRAEEALKSAEIALKSKQQFLSNMSHEIRTPMNAIIGFTKVVLKTELSPKQKEYLTAIKTSGDALIVLINDILDLSKVDAGKMEFEEIPFKMADSVSAMLHLFELKVQEKNLRLISEFDEKIPKVLLGDPVRLHQIILNLVGNAVKFTSEGSITTIIRLLEEDAEKVLMEFVVTDTGIGIGKDKMAKIFENFQQATSDTSRVFGGTGLGLAITKQLVEAQGGTIGVKSIKDKGSTFHFSLTFKKTNKETEAEPIALETNFPMKNVKVLVVEDLPLNQLLMRTIMEDFGYECDIAVNGKIAVEKVQSKRYDIILMDLQMPEMDGFDATKYIRTHLNNQIPIIALTADVTTTDLARCKVAGINDYISKPLDENLLKNKMKFFLNRVAHKKQLESKKVQKNSKKYIDLQYLVERTKSDPLLMTEIISLYLGQTKSLVKEMLKSTKTKNWKALKAIAHKMIPSFSIVGIGSEYEDLANKLQEYANKEDNPEAMQAIVLKLEKVLNFACKELEIELNLINKK